MNNERKAIKDYLQSTLGLTNGVDETFDGKTILKIIKDGSDTEDDKDRALNHFYNPLVDSGLHDWGKTGIKNPEWAKDYSSNEYSWKKGRQYYYEALTESDSKTRSQKFALAFRSLGQVMHLIQDMGVPAHTRKDMLSETI